MKDIAHYIANQHVVGNSDRWQSVFDPATSEVQARVALASTEEVGQAVAVASSA